jgi:hypothetical protein
LADSLSEQLDDAEKLFETTAAGEEEQQARRGETIGPDQGRSAYTDDLSSSWPNQRSGHDGTLRGILVGGSCRLGRPLWIHPTPARVSETAPTAPGMTTRATLREERTSGGRIEHVGHAGLRLDAVDAQKPARRCRETPDESRPS